LTPAYIRKRQNHCGTAKRRDGPESRHGQTIALGIEKVEIADVIETPAGPAYQKRLRDPRKTLDHILRRRVVIDTRYASASTRLTCTAALRLARALLFLRTFRELTRQPRPYSSTSMMSSGPRGA
jgi:hypothetical protein